MCLLKTDTLGGNKVQNYYFSLSHCQGQIVIFEGSLVEHPCKNMKVSISCGSKIMAKDTESQTNIPKSKCLEFHSGVVKYANSMNQTL